MTIAQIVTSLLAYVQPIKGTLIVTLIGILLIALNSSVEPMQLKGMVAPSAGYAGVLVITALHLFFDRDDKITHPQMKGVWFFVLAISTVVSNWIR